MSLVLKTRRPDFDSSQSSHLPPFKTKLLRGVVFLLWVLGLDIFFTVTLSSLIRSLGTSMLTAHTALSNWQLMSFTRVWRQTPPPHNPLHLVFRMPNSSGLSLWWFLLFLCLAVRQILLKTVNSVSKLGIRKTKSLTERKRGAGELARWLRAHTALAESLGSISSSRIEPAIDPGYPMPFLVNCVDICTHMHVSTQRHIHA